MTRRYYQLCRWCPKVRHDGDAEDAFADCADCEECSRCGGDGQVENPSGPRHYPVGCPKCGGTGRQRRDESAA